jgi:hypothetical protein
VQVLRFVLVRKNANSSPVKPREGMIGRQNPESHLLLENKINDLRVGKAQLPSVVWL